jgi:tRNA1(Val) A37 N6-methylase TrmN6
MFITADANQAIATANDFIREGGYMSIIERREDLHGLILVG